MDGGISLLEGYRLEVVAQHMVCAECGSKRVRLGPAFGD